MGQRFMNSPRLTVRSRRHDWRISRQARRIRVALSLFQEYDKVNINLCEYDPDRLGIIVFSP